MSGVQDKTGETIKEGDTVVTKIRGGKREGKVNASFPFPRANHEVVWKLTVSRSRK
jgi:hypothetical protein